MANFDVLGDISPVFNQSPAKLRTTQKPHQRRLVTADSLFSKPQKSGRQNKSIRKETSTATTPNAIPHACRTISSDSYSNENQYPSYSESQPYASSNELTDTFTDTTASSSFSTRHSDTKGVGSLYLQDLYSYEDISSHDSNNDQTGPLQHSHDEDGYHNKYESMNSVMSLLSPCHNAYNSYITSSSSTSPWQTPPQTYKFKKDAKRSVCKEKMTNIDKCSPLVLESKEVLFKSPSKYDTLLGEAPTFWDRFRDLFKKESSKASSNESLSREADVVLNRGGLFCNCLATGQSPVTPGGFIQQDREDMMGSRLNTLWNKMASTAITDDDNTSVASTISRTSHVLSTTYETMKTVKRKNGRQDGSLADVIIMDETNKLENGQVPFYRAAMDESMVMGQSCYYSGFDGKRNHFTFVSPPKEAPIPVCDVVPLGRTPPKKKGENNVTIFDEPGVAEKVAGAKAVVHVIAPPSSCTSPMRGTDSSYTTVDSPLQRRHVKAASFRSDYSMDTVEEEIINPFAASYSDDESTKERDSPSCQAQPGNHDQTSHDPDHGRDGKVDNNFATTKNKCKSCSESITIGTNGTLHRRRRQDNSLFDDESLARIFDNENDTLNQNSSLLSPTENIPKHIKEVRITSKQDLDVSPIPDGDEVTTTKQEQRRRRFARSSPRHHPDSNIPSNELFRGLKVSSSTHKGKKDKSNATTTIHVKSRPLQSSNTLRPSMTSKSRDASLKTTVVRVHSNVHKEERDVIKEIASYVPISAAFKDKSRHKEPTFEGWVAFSKGRRLIDSLRQNETGICRTDLRYVIIATPNLYVYTSKRSRSKRKKNEDDKDAMKTLHLTPDMEVESILLSKQHGQCVVVKDRQSTSNVICTLLPVLLRPSIFRDTELSQVVGHKVFDKFRPTLFGGEPISMHQRNDSYSSILKISSSSSSKQGTMKDSKGPAEDISEWPHSYHSIVPCEQNTSTLCIQFALDLAINTIARRR